MKVCDKNKSLNNKYIKYVCTYIYVYAYHILTWGEGQMRSICRILFFCFVFSDSYTTNSSKKINKFSGIRVHQTVMKLGIT